MKKLFFLGLTVVLMLTACTNDANMVNDLNSGASKSQVSSYIDNYFPDAKMTSISLEEGMTIATLNTGETLYFDIAGNPVDMQTILLKAAADSVDVDMNDSIRHPRLFFKRFRDSLMHEMRNDLKDRLQNDTTLRIHRDSLVKSLRDSVNKLIHDSIRTLIFQKKQERDSINTSIKLHRDSMKMVRDSIKTVRDSVRVERMALETAIKDYVAAEYAGYRVLGILKYSDCNGDYRVAIIDQFMKMGTDRPNQKTTDTSLKLYFDLEGNYLMKSERILTDAIPSVVTDIALDYTDYNLAKRSEIFTMADGSANYKLYLLPKLDLTSGVVSPKLVLLIASDGTVVCE